MKKIIGLIPAIIQDKNTSTVLMLGYMNQESFNKTLKKKRVWFYSRSKKRLWMKGETSGSILAFISAKFDCDNDAILIKAVPAGPTCHTGKTSCFEDEPDYLYFLKKLFELIKSRKKLMPKNSYTSYLFKKGLNKMCAKIKEESGEVILAAKKETKKRLIEESSDLLYHLMVLLASKKVDLKSIIEELQKRNKD
ncbi:MAG: bifunctional phosphoribosyl-AMP cyclohydrolase/phosphoribosyl-ATP pyrophosphatase, phosphoribosyl-ATP pyrophosphohydrolase / phosphoribosyl-AMP cyclohydrolase [Candidatus Peregrinibacteria bacterium GW2011_GWF2_38_29]|nr:MAG: bifunctional phosphoribosyl-AMP cyclohydrolase/phosphoribosyl-ATP pyrophosphatase, phosphoribosyl-ATP pyrophosphohydrolase / phosphoribosyl-AMP cyclohydrolase [Candidatus Peregrinibacteria bacterium GW2011_GWF2_38_29]HBB02342.1 bifunctional phosphoribosyl-AMP cyclohydrolase/phosphoribosyl-ATP diphosphatase [Candidatus Peregrinibacteria bacterium]